MLSNFKHERTDLLDLLEGMLKRIEATDRRSKAERLLQQIDVSVSLYVSQKTARFQNGAVRNSLLKLWKAAEKREGKQILLNLLSGSAPGTIEYLEKRAKRLWPSLELGPIFQCDLLTWADCATEEALAKALVRCCSDGRHFIEGRNRPGDNQSKGKFEPIILGAAEGATGKKAVRVPMKYADPCFEPVRQRSNAGRSTIDAEVELIMHLANDWYRVTGTFETGGRSDHSPMVEFITSVFRWAGIKNAENALRAYWAELKARKARSAPDIIAFPLWFHAV